MKRIGLFLKGEEKLITAEKAEEFNAFFASVFMKRLTVIRWLIT